MVRIWNTETGAIFHTLEVPYQGGLSFENSIGFLAFSSDGVLAYVTASSEKINLFDLEKKEIVATLEAEGDVTSLTFSADGQMVAAGTRGRLDQPVGCGDTGACIHRQKPQRRCNRPGLFIRRRKARFRGRAFR